MLFLPNGFIFHCSFNSFALFSFDVFQLFLRPVVVVVVTAVAVVDGFQLFLRPVVVFVTRVWPKNIFRRKFLFAETETETKQHRFFQ